jgi:hypothetical protein
MTNSPLDLLPGYKGYKDLEARRESDKQARLAVAAELARHTALITQVQNDAIREGGLAFMDALGTLKTAIQTLADKISAAPRGYTGLFATKNIQADTLDQVLGFDRELLNEATALGPVIESVEQAMLAGAGQQAAIRAAQTAVKAVATTFEKRAKILAGG